MEQPDSKNGLGEIQFLRLRGSQTRRGGILGCFGLKNRRTNSESCGRGKRGHEFLSIKAG